MFHCFGLISQAQEASGPYSVTLHFSVETVICGKPLENRCFPDSLCPFENLSGCKMIAWPIDNTYVRIGDKVFRQVIGIPMGTDCAPFLENLFLFSYEFQWMYEKLKTRQFYLLNKFKHCCRYIDDLFAINNNKTLLRLKHKIYPPELDITTDDENDHNVHYLDLDILIKNDKFSFCIYDKRDKFNFPIVNFPNLSGNIPTSHSYSVFLSQLVRYARGCLYFEDFQKRTNSLIIKLLKQNFRLHRLEKVYKKFCSRYKHLLHRYGKAVFDWTGLCR